MKHLAAVLVFASIAAPLSAQTLNLQTNPATATIHAIDVAGNRKLIGTGTAKFKLEKEAPNQIVVEAEGYEPLIRTFARGEKYPKIVPVELKNRLVKLAALPYDAVIHANGVAIGRQTAEVVVEDGKSVTVELKKPGFRTMTRTYTNMQGSDLPPTTDRMELADRVVSVSALPSGANIEADGNVIGETTGDVIIPRDKCVTARVVRAGFAPQEKIYCNKDASPVPPLNDAFTLRDRLTAVNVTPANARIVLNGREVGSGSSSVTIAQGSCA